MTFPFPSFSPASSSVPSLVPIYKGNLEDTTNTAIGGTYSFSSKDIGTADARRIVIVEINLSQNSVPSTMTIGGITATQIVNFNRVALYYAEVPTGTTATIAVTIITNLSTYCAGNWWIAYPVSSTPLDFNGASVGGSSPATASSIDVVSGGFVIAGGVIAALRTLTGTWSGTDSPVEDRDAQIEASGTYGGWSFSTTEAITGDFTMTPSSGGVKSVVAASWGAS